MAKHGFDITHFGNADVWRQVTVALALTYVGKTMSQGGSACFLWKKRSQS